MISMIGGILDQDTGQCMVLDHDFQHMGMGERALLRGGSIGFVFQAFNLLPCRLLARMPHKKSQLHTPSFYQIVFL